MSTINATQIKAQVRLVDLLARLGHHPVRPNGTELLYISMLHDAGTCPTFSVYEKLGVWYDRGLAKGGDLIDFGMAYWQLSCEETLDKIVSVIDQPVIKTTEAKRRHAHKLPYYQVEQIKELGANPAITAYLKERGIWQTAQGRLKEVYYYVEDEKKTRKHFFASGSQNETGSWEVRSKNFEGCLGHNALTMVDGAKNQLSVFESYFDYLSWLTEHQPGHTIIITTKLALLPQAISKAKGFTSVHLYFDNGKTGREATMHFKLQVPQAVDLSSIFQPYNDYNEKTAANLIKKPPGIFQHAFART